MRRFIADNLFAVASWLDIRVAFERESEADLAWFFRQWVEAPGVPELRLEAVSLEHPAQAYELAFTLVQAPPAFVLEVPLTMIVLADGSRETHRIEVAHERERFRYALDIAPVRLVLDENYDVMRKLVPAELPPSVERLVARERVTLLARAEDRNTYRSFIDALQHHGAEIVWQAPATEADTPSGAEALALRARRAK